MNTLFKRRERLSCTTYFSRSTVRTLHYAKANKILGREGSNIKFKAVDNCLDTTIDVSKAKNSSTPKSSQMKEPSSNLIFRKRKKMVEAARIALASKEERKHASTSLVLHYLRYPEGTAEVGQNDQPGSRLYLRPCYQPLTWHDGSHHG